MDISLQESIRGLRDLMLKESDFSQLPDSPLSVEDKALYASYRQQLRDLPSSQNIDAMQSISEVVWPIKP